MRIWFDFTNAPHINFFKNIIDDLKADHEIIITARDHSNTIALLEQEGLPYTIVGKHYGATKTRKIFGFFHRVFKLWQFLRTQNIDIAISHSSFYSPLVAKLLGANSIYLNDNEHAMGNILAFIFATRILVPETVSLEKIYKQGAKQSKVIQYPGVKEAIYLHAFEVPESNTDEKKVIYIRPEPWNAQYYKGDTGFLDALILGLAANSHEIVVLPRSNEQAKHYQGLNCSKLNIIKGALSLEQICRDCGVFIGAGGTMTREMAILGFPTISVYQDELLDVDKYLIAHGYMVHNTHPGLADVENLLCQNDKHQAAELLQKGQISKNLIIDCMHRLGNQN